MTAGDATCRVFTLRVTILWEAIHPAVGARVGLSKLRLYTAGDGLRETRHVASLHGGWGSCGT
ncbi:MAG: hypothetical protein AAFY20_22135 [Cyanobacteria bacterium J06639_14]